MFYIPIPWEAVSGGLPFETTNFWRVNVCSSAIVNYTLNRDFCFSECNKKWITTTMLNWRTCSGIDNRLGFFETRYYKPVGSNQVRSQTRDRSAQYMLWFEWLDLRIRWCTASLQFLLPICCCCCFLFLRTLRSNPGIRTVPFESNSVFAHPP